jgi:outer membrane lipopolysaccharide assembly protein LptE/RlpB
MTGTVGLRGLAACAAVALAASACAYSVNPSSGSTYRTIAIPVLENETLEYGVEDLATRTLIDTFQEDNRMEVVSPGEAQTILRGKITGYSRDAYTFDASEQVQEYKVQLTLDLEYGVVATGKNVWRENNYIVWATYKPADGETEETGKERAMAKLADEVVARTIEGW